MVNEADTLITNTIKKVNNELISLYWNIGKLIYDYKRDNNSKYGDNVVKRFSEILSFKYGKGFDKRNVFKMVKFYELFPIITFGSQADEKVAPGRQFKNASWSHIRELLKFKDIKIMKFYLDEIENKNLSKNQLITNIKTKGFECTISNQRSETVKNRIKKHLKTR